MKRVNYTLLFLFLMTCSYISSAHDIPKPSVTIGAMQLNDNALDGLAGTGVSIDDNATVAYLTVDYYVSPNLAFEGGKWVTLGQVTF